MGKSACTDTLSHLLALQCSAAKFCRCIYLPETKYLSRFARKKTLWLHSVNAGTMAPESCARFMRNRSGLQFGHFVVVAIFFCALLSNISSAQSLLFVSPNTRDHLTDQDAADSMNSFEESNFLAVAKFLAEKICSTPHVFSAEGIYAGSAENSSLVTGCSAEKARYMGELLGRYAHQKWILVFDPSSAPESNERLFLVEFSIEHLPDVIKHVRQYLMSGATVISRTQVSQIYIWTTDHSQEAAVHAFADAEHGAIQEIHGKGTLIGDDDRMTARGIFDQRIAAYERAHKLSFSMLLWSKKLHDMTGLRAGETPK